MKFLFKELGILHQRSYVHTPHQNGSAERKHLNLLEVARFLRFQWHIPLRFWGHWILTATYVINRLPLAVLGGKSPYELFFEMKPILSHLKTFECLCYGSAFPRVDKFASRALPSVFMGYSTTTKGYILFDLAREKFYVNMDVMMINFPGLLNLIIEWHFSKGWAFYYISSWPFGTWSCESSANYCNLWRCTSPVTYHYLCSHIYSWSFASKKITQSDKGSSLACWLHY